MQLFVTVVLIALASMATLIFLPPGITAVLIIAIVAGGIAVWLSGSG